MRWLPYLLSVEVSQVQVLLMQPTWLVMQKQIRFVVVVFDYLLIHISPTKLDLAYFNSMLYRHT